MIIHIATISSSSYIAVGKYKYYYVANLFFYSFVYLFIVDINNSLKVLINNQQKTSKITKSNKA